MTAIRRLVYIYFIFPIICFTQNNVIKQLSKLKDDSLKCVYLSNEIENETQANVWLVYNDELLLISEKQLLYKPHNKFYNSCIAYAKNNKGFYFESIGKKDSAMSLYFNALDLQLDINDYFNAGVTANNLGYLAYNTGDFVLALKYYTKALRLSEAAKNKPLEITIHSNLAAYYNDLLDSSSAFVHTNKALEIRLKLKDTLGMATSYNALATMFFIKGEKAKAYDYVYKSIKLGRSINRLSGLANAYSNLSSFYLKDNKLDSSLVYAKSSYELFTKLNDLHGIALSGKCLGLVYFETKSFSESIKYFQEAYDLSKGLANPKLMSSCSNYLARLYYNFGDYKKAYEYASRYISFNDSLSTLRYNELVKQKGLLLGKLLNEDSIKVSSKDLESMKADKSVENKFTNYTIVFAVMAFVLLIIVIALLFRLKYTKRST